MALHLNTDIILPASPEKAWAELTDFSRYPEWNPFVTHAAGDWQEGNRVSITAGGMDFKPVILNFQPERELRWRGSLLFRGLFDGEHYFTLTDRGDGTTLLTHGELFQGIMVPIFRKKLHSETRAGFVAMNEALRDRLLP